MLIGDFTSGGQTLNHRIIMFWQVIKKGSWVAVLVSLAIFSCYVYAKVPGYGWKHSFAYTKAKIFRYFASKDVTQKYKLTNGKVIVIKSCDVLGDKQINTSVGMVHSIIVGGAWKSLLSSFGLFLLISLIYTLHGKWQKENKHVRGNSLVKALVLKKALIKKMGFIVALNTIRWTKHKLPVPIKAVVKNTMIVGTTGSGKTIALLEIMAQVRKKGYKAIVYDVKGTFIEKFYRPGRDIILNPLDLRFPNWNLWSECKVPADFDRIAATMMPEHIATSDPFWIKSARTIFSAAARQLQQKGRFDTRELLKQIFNDADDEDKLIKLLKGTEAESLVSKDIKQVALSIKATLTNYCKALMYLPAYDETKEDFSITEHLQDENKSDGWIFISVVDDGQHEALKPLISIWADIAFQAILRLKRNRDRRIFSFIDELPSLQRLSSLERLLSLGREYGNSFYTTVQDVNQFRTIYGNQASTLLGLMNTKLFMAVESPEAADWMSRALFDKEYLESKEGLSHGANTVRDGVTISKDHRNDRVVTPGEFAALEELEGYLKFPGNCPVAKVHFEYREYKEIASDLEPRDISSADFDLSNVMPAEKLNSSGKSKSIKNKSKFSSKNEIVKTDDIATEEEKAEQPAKSKKPRKTRKDKGIKKKTDGSDVESNSQEDAKSSDVDAKEDEPKEFKTVVGYVASPSVHKNEHKKTTLLTVALGENQVVREGDNAVASKAVWYKLVFFDVLAEEALKEITKGCRVEAYGEYIKDTIVDEDSGEETTKHEILVKKFKVLGKPKQKVKPDKKRLAEKEKLAKADDYIYETKPVKAVGLERGM